MLCIAVKMIKPAITDFSKLTSNYRSWLGLMRELLLFRVPKGSGSEFSAGYC